MLDAILSFEGFISLLTLTLMEIILGVDIVIFIVVLYIIRKSLHPFEAITLAISKIKSVMYPKIIISMNLTLMLISLLLSILIYLKRF